MKKKHNTSTALISELFPPPRLVTRGILQTGPVVHLAESQTPESIQVDTRTHALLLILAQVITNSLPIFLSQSCESISQFQMDSWPKVAAAIKGVFAIETSGQGTGVSRMNPTNPLLVELTLDGNRASTCTINDRSAENTGLF